MSAAVLAVVLRLRQETNRWWSANALALELSLSIADAQRHLEHLTSLNLLDVRVSDSVLYRYHPGTPELANLVDQVADAHAEHRDLIIATLAGPTR